MSKSFKEMDPEHIRELIDGHENVISPAMEREQSFLKSISCPRCGEFETEARINSKRPFSHGMILPNKILVCLRCQTEFEPHTKLILRAI